jgi:vitamin B12 transporter
MTTKSLSLITAALLTTTQTFADETLEPIHIITTNKTDLSIQKTTAHVTVITAQDIEEHGYQSVAQAINSVSGISVAHAGGLGQQTSFFMRGADSGKVLVLLDGMRLNDPSTTNGTALLDSLTTSTIAQIEIIKGGTSSIWGSNASAGVINIITKEAQKGLHGSLALGYGSFNTKETEAQLSYKDEKLTAQVLASYLDTDGFSALAPREAEKDGYTNKDLNLKVGYAFNEHHRVNLSYNRLKTETEYDDSWSVDLAEDDYSHATSDQENYAFDFIFDLGNYSATLHASRGEYDRDYYTTGMFGDGHNVYKATLKEYALINAYNYTSGKAVLGLEYKELDGFNQYNAFPASQSDYTNKAIYLSNLYDINEGTLLETNLRYDNNDAFENKMTYKIGIKHQHHLIEGVTSSANYYSSYDAPSAYQLANPTFGTLLKPSYTKGYDVSVAYKQLLSLTYFNNKVEDAIDWDPVNFGYINVDGRSKFSGLEAQSSYKFETINLNLSANYTHLFTYTKEDGTDLPRRAKDTINASITYYTENDMHFGLDAQYVGDREEFGQSTGNYTVWNLNFSSKIIDDIDLTINAKNIFDKEYESVAGYATADRSIYAKIKYSF